MIKSIILLFFLTGNIALSNEVKLDEEEILTRLDNYLQDKKYDSLSVFWNNNRLAKISDPLLMKTYFILGEKHRKTFQFDSAEHYYKTSLSLAEELNNIEFQIKNLDKLGSNYRQSGNNYLALETYLTSLKKKEALLSPAHKNAYQFGLGNEYLGLTYYLIGKDSLSISFYQIAVEWYQKAQNQQRKISCFNNLGLSYLHWAQDIRRNPFLYNDKTAKKKEHLLKKALEHFKYVEVDPQYPRKELLFQNLSATYSEMGKLDSAYYYVNSCKKIREKENSQLLPYTYNNLGHVFFKMKNFDSANFYYRKSMQHVKKLQKQGHQNATDLSLPLYINYSDFFAARETYDSAYYYLSLFHDPYLEKFNKESDQQVQQLNIIYETEKKENQILAQKTALQQASLQRNNLLYATLTFAILALAAIGFYTQRTRRLKLVGQRNAEIHKNEVAQLLSLQESKAFDAMLEGQEKERKRMAEELHDRLGSTLSAAKMHIEGLPVDEQLQKQHVYINKLIDKAVEDTRQISHNLLSGILTKFGLLAALKDLQETINATEKVTFSIKTIQVDERLEMEIEINIYRIVQELLSNTLKHAHAKNFVVILEKSDNLLKLNIKDDGIGSSGTSKKGIGLKNINSRVSKMNGEWEIHFTEGKGTSANISIPI